MMTRLSFPYFVSPYFNRTICRAAYYLNKRSKLSLFVFQHCALSLFLCPRFLCCAAIYVDAAFRSYRASSFRDTRVPSIVATIGGWQLAGAVSAAHAVSVSRIRIVAVHEVSRSCSCGNWQRDDAGSRRKKKKERLRREPDRDAPPFLSREALNWLAEHLLFHWPACEAWIFSPSLKTRLALCISLKLLPLPPPPMPLLPASSV